MNARVVGQGASFSDALALLDRFAANPGHTFWDSETPPAGWPQWLRDRVQGYRQVTDATLLATAVDHDGALVTMDGGVLSLLPESQRSRVRVIVPEVA